jgi:CubicO group peptidase (beta-lactamase class C family)
VRSSVRGAIFPEMSSPLHSGRASHRTAVGLFAVLALGLAPAARAATPPPRASGPRVAPGFTWPRSSPEEQGLDSGALASYRARAGSGEFGPVDSLLVVRHGVLVEEAYYRGWRSNQLHAVYSVTKSVTSLVLGIAFERGLIPSLDTPVLSQFPEYPVVTNPSEVKDRMTVDDLLTMRTGLDWKELSVPYSDPSNDLIQMFNSSDWPKYVLDRPMAMEPGTRFLYNTGGSVLLGGLLRNDTGRQPAELARQWLFAPLGIDRWSWDTAPGGLSNTGSGLHLRPQDMARIGQLVLQGGLWQGVRLVPAQWLAVALAHHVTLTQNFGYAYQWWIMPLDPSRPSSDPDNQVWLAWGYASQFIFIVPALDVVVVSTSSDFDEVHQGALEFVQAMLAAAVLYAPSPRDAGTARPCRPRRAGSAKRTRRLRTS